jgi:hypothetical protein
MVTTICDQFDFVPRHLRAQSDNCGPMRCYLGSPALPPPLCGSGKFSFFGVQLWQLLSIEKKFGMFQSEWALLDGKSKNIC